MPNLMIAKICGIRTLDDALAATDCGADMLGFNFHGLSSRYIDPPRCKRLINALRRERAQLPLLVGVFVNLLPAQIEVLLEACGLDLAQLSGDEGPDSVLELRGRAFKAIRPRDLSEARGLAALYRPEVRRSHVPAVLLDASCAGLYGGSGHSADWTIGEALAEEMPILLAGGLRPDNVAEAIAVVRPWGVDVASGVEQAPGVKDPDKMASFVRNAKGSTLFHRLA